MSNALENFVPTLEGPNFQTWKRQMRAFLQSQDLWSLVNATALRPVPADPAAPTDAELARMHDWDTQASRALGNIVLRLAPPVYQRVETMNAPDAWVELQRVYGDVSPSQVFEFFKRTILFKLDTAKAIRPQIDYLDSLYSALTAEQVNLPDFIKAMVLLTALPSAWEAPIIQTVMQGGTITAITFDSTKETILRYWDTEKAKKVGKNSFTANKISAVKRKPNDPSFISQKGKAPYKGDNLQKKRKNQRGKRGGRDKSGQQTHFANTASLSAQSSHTVAHYGPSGLINRIATDTPITSSFGGGPFASFNDAMTLAEDIGVPKSIGNVKRLEERITCAAPQRKKGKYATMGIPPTKHVILLSSDESEDSGASGASEMPALVAQIPPVSGWLTPPLTPNEAYLASLKEEASKLAC